MKLSEPDKMLLKDMCRERDLSYEKVQRLLETIKKFELKERRAGIYDALKEIIQTELDEKAGS